MTKKKSIICLFVALFAIFLAPVVAKAKEPITVYLLRGETCPHCEEALKFFTKLKKDEEYKDIFNLRHLEVWNNDANFEIGKEIYKAMGEEEEFQGSVPYIVIGETAWSGYSASSDEELKNAIKNAYDNDATDKLKDIVGDSGELLEISNSGWISTAIILVLAVAIIGGTIVMARSGMDEEPEKDDSKKETKKEEKLEEKIKVEEHKKEEAPKQQTKPTAKKTTTNKKNTSNKKTTTKKNAQNKSKKK